GAAAAAYDFPLAMACAHTQLGNKDEAFFWLRKGAESKVSGLTDVSVMPFFETLHSDPRFADLVRRVGLPQ
ncbi:MAG: hypothetical protein ACJ754_18470, partial [Pyrinomonadaceae bacterium]